MHFQRLNFVLVCPPVEKKLLHYAVFNILRRPCRINIKSPSSTPGPWPARNIGNIPRMSLPAATVTVTANPWLRILGALEKKITRHSYDTWLKPTRFSHINGNIIYV